MEAKKVAAVVAAAERERETGKQNGSLDISLKLRKKIRIIKRSKRHRIIGHFICRICVLLTKSERAREGEWDKRHEWHKEMVFHRPLIQYIVTFKRKIICTYWNLVNPPLAHTHTACEYDIERAVHLLIASAFWRLFLLDVFTTWHWIDAFPCCFGDFHFHSSLSTLLRFLTPPSLPSMRYKSFFVVAVVVSSRLSVYFFFALPCVYDSLSCLAKAKQEKKKRRVKRNEIKWVNV